MTIEADRNIQSAAPIIRLRDVAVSYDEGRSLAVDGVSFAVPRGQFLVLVGASGSGKTTLLKTINRLVELWRGEILMAGAPIHHSPAPQLRRRIGYAFQGVGLFPHMSVGENIAATPSLLGWPRERIASRVDALLDLVELPRDYAARAPEQLSGGQRQRVGLARALAAEPEIVLLDEPFGALDPVIRVGLSDAYRAIHDRLGTTTVMVTHDMQEALLLADRLVVMSAGRLIADESPAALLKGAGGEEVRRLMESPRKQAERLRLLMERESRAR